MNQIPDAKPLLAHNRYQSAVFIIGGAIVAVISAYTSNTPNNVGTWAALVLVIFQVALNTFQSLARTFDGVPLGKTFLNLYHALSELLPLLTQIAAHLPDIIAFTKSWQSDTSLLNIEGTGLLPANPVPTTVTTTTTTEVTTPSPDLTGGAL